MNIFRSHVASTVADVESLLSFRRDYYAVDHYMFYVIFEAFPATEEYIAVEFSIDAPPSSPPSSRGSYHDSDAAPEP